MTKEKALFFKFIYVLIWGIGIGFSSFAVFVFPDFILGTSKNVHFSTQSINQYIYPIVLIMALFLTDVCYAFCSEWNKKNYTCVLEVMCCFALFMIFFLLSILATRLTWQLIWITGIALTLLTMKFFKTNTIPYEDPKPEDAYLPSDGRK